MALSKIQTGLLADGSVDTTQLAADAVDNTILDLADNYKFAGALSATGGTNYGMFISNAIGDSNVPYNSWGTPNNTYYVWNLPKAGVYRLFASWRVRLWGVHGMILSRLYNNTTSTVITDIEGAPTTRMNLENRGGGTAETLNIQISHEWLIETTADTQTIHHQAFSDNNSTNSSIQSDGNGWNIHSWHRIG